MTPSDVASNVRAALRGEQQSAVAQILCRARHRRRHRQCQGEAVQVDPIKPKLIGPGTKRLKLMYDQGLRLEYMGASIFANTGSEYGKYSLPTRPDSPEW